MASGYPDWTRAIRLLGIDADGNPVTILADSTGRLYSLVMGEDAGGVLRAVRVDGSGQMVMVPRGQSGHYMAIDSDGYMTAVLKGAYGAALRTIGLDGEGRITAYMVDDESQWGDVVKTGNAELAARLGSPVAWDWRGKVAWWTDFRHGIGGLHTATSGAGASVTLDPTKSLSGGYSVKLVGGSASEYYAGVGVAIDTPPSARVGVCIRWASDSEFEYLNLRMQIYDGVKYQEAFIRYCGDDQEIQYLDSGRAWQTLEAQKFYIDDYAWHGLKLVMEIEQNDYLRCLAGSTEHDMADLGTYAVLNATDQRLFCTVYVYSHSGNNEYAWIDSMIISSGEPT